MQYVRTVTQKGQVTIPVAIRRALGLKPNDKLAFRIDDTGVHIEPAKSSLLAGYGAVKIKGGLKDLKRLRREFEEAAANEVLKEL